MRVGRGALLFALALSACKPRAGTEADAGAASVPGRPGTVTLPGCETLFPADVRELTLNGFTVKESRACPTCGPVCTFRSAAEPETTVSIVYDCQEHYATADLHALLEPTLNAGGIEVPALGRAAARRNPVQGMTQVVAWDDDSPCAVVVTWLGGDTERALDVTRLALQVHSDPGRAAHPASAAEDTALTGTGGTPLPGAPTALGSREDTLLPPDVPTPSAALSPPAPARRPTTPATSAPAVRPSLVDAGAPSNAVPSAPVTPSRGGAVPTGGRALGLDAGTVLGVPSGVPAPHPVTHPVRPTEETGRDAGGLAASPHAVSAHDAGSHLDATPPHAQVAPHLAADAGAPASIGAHE
ncbi:hypothetical protein KRR26_02345 [Corallococcus sp. M34]|uniref:hypothetical protein n=1 Tax=Citreicoccus inhibens TaxID=2849499 RepID=UPI001C23B8E3|nr:hypothetical protein [Citreicoccus inhibens]MBU8894424.1 hypothetical protein [Citreicoccus inhibens]